MNLQQYDSKPQASRFPRADEILSDIVVLSTDFTYLIGTPDYAVIYSFVYDFLRLKNQFRLVSSLVSLADTYENSFIRYGREALQRLLLNCLLTVWDPAFERRFLDLCISYYYTIDKQILRTQYRPIATNYTFRFLYASNKQIDLNAAAFIVLVMLKLLGINDFSLFLSKGFGQQDHLGATSDFDAKASYISSQIAGTNSRTQRYQENTQDNSMNQQSAESQDQLKSQILMSLQSRLNGAYSSQTGNQYNLQSQLEQLKQEQVTLVIEATEKINKYKAKLGEYRGNEKKANSKIAELEIENSKLSQLRRQMEEQIAEKSQRIKEITYQLGSEKEAQQKLYVRVAGIEQENRQLQSDIAVMTERMKLLQRQYEDVLRELNETKPQLLKATSEASISNHLQDKLREMSSENAMLVRKYNEIVEQIESFYGPIKRLEQEKSQCYAYLQAAQAKLYQMQFNQEQFYQQQQQISQLKSSLEEAGQQISKLKAIANSYDFYTEVEYKSMQLQQKISECLQFKERIAVLEVESANKTRQIAKSQNEHEAELSTIQQQLSAARQQVNELREDYAYITSLKSVVSQQKQEITTLTEANKLKQEQLDQRHEEIGQLKIKAQDMMAELALQGKAAEFQRIIETLKARVSDLETQVLEAQKLARQHELSGLEGASVKEQYGRLQKDYEAKCTELINKSNEVQQLKMQLGEYNNQIEMLSKQLYAGKLQLDELNQQFAELKQMDSTDNLNSVSNLNYQREMEEKDKIIFDLEGVASSYRNYAYELREYLKNTVSTEKAQYLMEQTEVMTERISQLEAERKRLTDNTLMTQNTDKLNSSQELALLKENNELKSQLALLNTAKTSNLDFTAGGCFNCYQLKNQLSSKDNEIRDLREELENVTQELAFVKEMQLYDLYTEIQDLKQQAGNSDAKYLKSSLYTLLDDIDQYIYLNQLDDVQKNHLVFVGIIKDKIKAFLE